MNAKWFFSTFILALAFFGIFQDKGVSPNQEIALEFVDAKVAQKDIQTAIESLKKQLLEAGATNIKVQESDNNTLKISYYSDVNVANIKEALAKEHQIVLDYSEHTSQHQNEDSNSEPTDKVSNYNLDVYEIKNGTDTSNFGGKYVLEVNYDNDRFTNPNVHFPLLNVPVNKTDHIVKTAYRVNKYVVISIDNTSHKEPEVRAGPSC